MLALGFNAIAIAVSVTEFPSLTTLNGALNKLLIILIGNSDFLMGVYLITVAYYDTAYGDSYCKNKFQWLTSGSCFMLGITNTVATQTSLFAMTTLSIFRVASLTSLVPSPITSKSSKVKLILTPIVLLTMSLLLAAIPLVKPVEDYFVNGLYYHQNPLFTASVNKIKHTSILQAYLGRFPASLLSWRNYDKLVGNMFTDDYDGVQGKRVHFYGNSGVCVFKYIVGPTDPQQIYSLLLLFVNIACFVMIAVSYLIINYKSNYSSRQAGATSSRQKALYAKVTAIIVTDFLAWIPFTVVCVLNYLLVIDATPFYSVFSVIILPLNSVINPVLYVNQIAAIKSVSRAVSTKMNSRATGLSYVSAGTSFGNRSRVGTEQPSISKTDTGV